MLKAVPTAPLMAPTLAVNEPLTPLQVDALPGGAGRAERVDGDIERAALVDVDCLAAARQVDVGDGQGTYRAAAAGAAVVDAGLAALRGGDVEAFDGIAGAEIDAVVARASHLRWSGAGRPSRSRSSRRAAAGRRYRQVLALADELLAVAQVGAVGLRIGDGALPPAPSSLAALNAAIELNGAVAAGRGGVVDEPDNWPDVEGRRAGAGQAARVDQRVGASCRSGLR